MPDPDFFKGWPQRMVHITQAANGRPAVIDEIHDADTWHHWTLLRPGTVVYDAGRIADFYAPELWTPEGKEALARALEVYESLKKLNDGGFVRLRARQLYTSFDRWVTVYTVPQTFTDLSTLLIEAGAGSRIRPLGAVSVESGARSHEEAQEWASVQDAQAQATAED